ncbi:ferredoxin [Actinokineospora sp. NBRC 105648]|uniref:ferredoxin n=1 Tax=Actinokineospora sp. NBRC 105648 TaxID=3032206 RepID=UPI00249FC2F8|nr:ferredoxin [Actinokineospora sp. NBRC 105648]GLZ38856.1 hypothetical protein Acsp05_24800 [Actinokineospora sp. NBRC 105648]
MTAPTWTVHVDSGLCMGSGICAGAKPGVFRLDGPAAEAAVDQLAPDEAVLDVADMCPAGAITVHDAEGTEIGPRP